MPAIAMNLPTMGGHGTENHGRKIVHTVDARGLMKRHQVARHISSIWLVKQPSHTNKSEFYVDVHPSMRANGVRFLREVYEEQDLDMADYDAFMVWDRYMGLGRVGAHSEGNFSEFPPERLPKGVTMDAAKARGRREIYAVPPKVKADAKPSASAKA